MSYVTKLPIERYGFTMERYIDGRDNSIVEATCPNGHSIVTSFYRPSCPTCKPQSFRQ